MNKSIKPLSVTINNKNAKPLNITMGNNVVQNAGGMDDLTQFIELNNSLVKLEDKILKSFLDGCFINIALQKNKNRYSSCFPPQKTIATLNKDSSLSTFGKLCIYDELFFMTMGEKFNIVSKFPNSIINNLSQQLKDSLKTCKSSNSTKTQKQAKRDIPKKGKYSKHRKFSKRRKRSKKSFGRFKKGRRV